MSHLIGRGRTARETYPQSPAAGGGSGAGAPLSRQRFIDGGTVQGGLTGAAVAPFKTIAQFMAARGNSSVEDAQTNYVGWVTPFEPAGYVENVSFVPYASTELRAPAEGSINGVAIVGNVQWANIAGANTPGAAVVALHNIGIAPGGSFTVTDDVGAPPSSVVISSDGGAVQIPEFDSSTTVNLASVLFRAVGVGPVTAGSASDSAAVSFLNALVNGDVSAFSIGAENTLFGGLVSTIEVNDNASFTNCRFTVGSNPVLTAPNGAVFDGLSWNSFVEAGGTKAAGTVVLVIGGYDGAAVNGASPTAASTDLAINGIGATAGFTDGGNRYRIISSTPTLIRLLLSGGLPGDTMVIIKGTTAPNAIAVQTELGGGGFTSIVTLPASQLGFLVVRFTTAGWIFEQGGSLA